MKLAVIAVQTLLAALLATAPAAMAQAPSRNGDVWDGRDHEPVPGVVHREERAAGIAPSTAQQRHENAVVEHEASKLISKSQRDDGDGASVSR